MKITYDDVRVFIDVANSCIFNSKLSSSISLFFEFFQSLSRTNYSTCFLIAMNADVWSALVGIRTLSHFRSLSMFSLPVYFSSFSYFYFCIYVDAEAAIRSEDEAKA